MLRVRYLHGRPSAHPLPARLARAVGADFEYIDFRMRWHDRNRGKLFTITSWLVCAATLPRKRSYDVFLIDGLHISPVLMKLLFLRRDQKIVANIANQTPYFLYTHQFSQPVERLHLWALKHYDALLCEGEMLVDLAQRLLPESCPPRYETFIGPPAERAQVLVGLEPELHGRSIVCIADGPGGFRVHYKGLDLMAEAVALAAEHDSEIELNIIGRWDEDVVEACLSRLPADSRRHVRFRGHVSDVDEWLLQASLYLQCSRGDASPTAALEAMTAGVVPLVSEWTGVRQIVQEIDTRLIAPLRADEIAARILWYFGLESGDRLALSRRSREAVSGYTEEAAVEHYQRTFAALSRDLGLTTQAA